MLTYYFFNLAKRMEMNTFKNICVFVILGYCFVFSINAQTEQHDAILRTLTNAKILDSASIRITYSLIFVADSNKLNEKLIDRKILLIGNSVQHFYSYYSRFRDSVVTANSKKGGKATKLPDFPKGVCAEWYNIYNNFPSKKQTTVENISNFSMYVFNENLEDFPQWNITRDTQTILNYLCYKAICKYHGRVWEAWFTLDIPINAGPWKLHGLPGLILKANDERQHYKFECNGIERLKNPEPILMYEVAYKAASDPNHTGTREQYLKELNQFYNNYVNSLLANGCCVAITDDSGKEIEFIETPNQRYADRNIQFSVRVNARDRYKKIPYNPIELK